MHPIWWVRPGVQRSFEERGKRPAQRLELGSSPACLRGSTLTVRSPPPQVRAQRRIDLLAPSLPEAGHQGRGISSASPPRAAAQQRPQRGTASGHQQMPLVSRIEAMHELELPARPRGSQRLDHPEGQPAAPVHRDPRQACSAPTAAHRCEDAGSTCRTSAHRHRRGRPRRDLSYRGSRTVSTVSRCSGAARVPLTRTSPRRITRKMRLRGTPANAARAPCRAAVPAAQSRAVKYLDRAAALPAMFSLAPALAFRGAFWWVVQVFDSSTVRGYTPRR